MKQSLIGGLIGGLVVALLAGGLFFVSYNDQAEAEPVPAAQEVPQNWQISPYRRLGQPIDPTPVPPGRFKQDSTNCTDTKNLFTCNIP